VYGSNAVARIAFHLLLSGAEKFQYPSAQVTVLVPRQTSPSLYQVYVLSKLRAMATASPDRVGDGLLGSSVQNPA
jgi:hypothetical protein